MKKVLIITHLSHATPRIPALAKYLPEFGWEPIIVAPRNTDNKNFIQSGIKIIETHNSVVLGFWKKLFGFNGRDQRGIRSKTSLADHIITLCGEIINYPDSEKKWRPYAIMESKRILESDTVNALVSSSSPVTSHIIAKELKIKYRIPWIADLRDLWTQNHNYQYSFLRKAIEKQLELKTMRWADALVTVSPPWTQKLKTLHGRETAYSITNGFDPETLSREQAILTPKFTITYTGNIYQGKQEPSKFFVALKDLFSDGIMNPDDVEVRFYGQHLSWLAKEIEEYALERVVKQHGVISNVSSLENQRQSQLLLLLNWEDPKVKGCYPLKVFEYLAAKRPIIACGGWGGDVIEDLLERTKAGIYASTIGDIKEVLKRLYAEYKLTGVVGSSAENKKINRYSYRESAGQFAEILDGLSK